MRILVIGSLALRQAALQMGHEESFVSPKDIDIIASFEDGLEYLRMANCHTIYPADDAKKLIGFARMNGVDKPFECEIAWGESTAKTLIDEAFPSPKDFGLRYAPLNVLYALKMSHRFRRNSPHFLKTMRDIHLMRSMGATIPESGQEWFRLRERETYNYGHPKLNTSKKEFFSSDSIDYKYDHDSIHLAIKTFDQPAYNYFKPNTNEVFCSKEMFKSCSEEIKLAAVYEESGVLAIERSLVPHPGVLTPERAFATALEKVCTSITSGWFRDYAWENYNEVLRVAESRFNTDLDYFRLFQEGLKNGTVKPFK